MGIFLQYNSLTSAGVNAEAAKNFGITNITALYDAGVDVAGQMQKVCIPVVGIALLIKMFMFITKVYNQQQVDFFDLGKTVLLILFLTQYKEVMTQLNSLISYFTDNIQHMFDVYGSGHTVVDKVNDVYDKYKEKHPDPGFFDRLSTIGDWIVANCTHLIIVITRAITYVVRSLVMVFLIAVGPLAILATLFPGYEDTLKSYLKYYISVGFWSVTLAVLDLILYQYLDHCKKEVIIDGISQVNIGIALMYLIVPYLTSKYIGGQGSQFMSRMIQSATAAVALSGKVGKSTSPGMSMAAEKTISAGQKIAGKADRAMAGGVQNTLAGRGGQLYGAIKRNTISKNKSE